MVTDYFPSQLTALYCSLLTEACTFPFSMIWNVLFYETLMDPHVTLTPHVHSTCDTHSSCAQHM